jgi:glutaredoxin
MTKQTLHIWGYAHGCPACADLKALLLLLGKPYVFYPIDRNSPERAALRDAGFKTVPQVFDHNGWHVGDYADFRKAAATAISTLSPPSGAT